MSRSPKKTVRVTTVREEEERQENPIPKLVRSYLLDGEEYSDDLRNYQYKINVSKFSRDGRPVAVAGRIYDNLEDLPYQLGSRFGTSRFRLFVNVFDEKNEKVCFVKIEDFSIEWDGEEEPEEGHAVESESLAGHLQLEQLRHQNAKELKQMEMNKEMFIAALSAKSSGGPKLSDLMEVLKTGISLGEGKGVPTESNGESDGDPLMALANGPLGQLLAAIVTKKMSDAAPSITPSAAGPISVHPDPPAIQ